MALAHKLQTKNYVSQTISQTTPTPVHQVRVGEYEDRAEALEALELLKRHGLAPLIMVKR